MNEELPPYLDNHTVSIAVMGTTGSGKSTFINLVSGSNLITSARLESCTQDVEVGAEFQLDGRAVKLIDTPGFDDTTKSEVEILKLIADFLADQYAKKYTLHGVIYLHRISDIRMGGVSKRSFRLFRNICGEKTLKNVAIVTNMWDKVTLEEGRAREMELRTDERFFKPTLDEGALMLRHNNTIESARDIIQKIFRNHPLPLDIQKELVEKHTPLYDTNAGRGLSEDLQESTQLFMKEVKVLKEEIADAMRESDERAKQELAEALRKSNGELVRVQNEVKNLHARITDFDVERYWRKMGEKAKVVTLFRRSQGAEQAQDMNSFWSALGDTRNTVSDLRAIFHQYPMAPVLQAKLLDGASGLNEDSRKLLRAWVRANPKASKAMKTSMASAIHKSKSRKSHVPLALVSSYSMIQPFSRT